MAMQENRWTLQQGESWRWAQPSRKKTPPEKSCFFIFNRPCKGAHRSHCQQVISSYFLFKVSDLNFQACSTNLGQWVWRPSSKTLGVTCGDIQVPRGFQQSKVEFTIFVYTHTHTYKHISMHMPSYKYKYSTLYWSVYIHTHAHIYI